MRAMKRFPGAQAAEDVARLGTEASQHHGGEKTRGSPPLPQPTLLGLRAQMASRPRLPRRAGGGAPPPGASERQGRARGGSDLAERAEASYKSGSTLALQ